MRAIVTVPPTPSPFERGPRLLALSGVAGRPFLQHVVEHLVASGVGEIDVVAGRGADEVEAALGDGERWGCAIRYHFGRDAARAVRAVAKGAPADELLVVGRADQLPQLTGALAERRSFDGPDGWWTGWAVVPPRDLAGRWESWSDLEMQLAEARVPGAPAPAALQLRSADELGRAQADALSRRFPGLLIAAREVSPGVWVARNSSVHPTAELRAPAYIGEGSSVGEGTRVGPNAEVGAGCMLDAGSSASEAVLLPGSYVGSGVSLSGVVVDGPRVLRPEHPSAAVRVGTHIFGALPAIPAPVPAARALLTRAVGAAGYVAALPVLFVAAAWLRATRPGPVRWRRRFVQMPTLTSEAAWKERTVTVLAPPSEGTDGAGWVIPPTARGLILEFLPALAAVARGHLKLVGLPPRDAASLKRAAPARNPALVASPAGLVTEAAFGGMEYIGSLSDILLADVYQAHTTSPWSNAKRVARFVAAALNPLPARKRPENSLPDFLTANR